MFAEFTDYSSEQAIILTRITNDERSIRRIIKKFHNYTSLNAQSPGPTAPLDQAQTSGQPPLSLEDAREAFLVELSSFELLLKKSVMICEAETRQVEEYCRDKEQIGKPHITGFNYLSQPLACAHRARARDIKGAN
jgi:THO complex subunit 7